MLLALAGVVLNRGAYGQSSQETEGQCLQNLKVEQQLCEDLAAIHGSRTRSLPESTPSEPSRRGRGRKGRAKPLKGALFRNGDDDPEGFQGEGRNNAVGTQEAQFTFLNDCIVKTFSSANSSTEAKDSLADAVADAFALATGCADAEASARAQSEAIAEAISIATAKTRVEFSGNCDESFQGKATALAAVEGSAIAEAFAEAVAEATNDLATAFAVVWVEDIQVAVARAVAESMSALTGGSDVIGTAEEVISKTATEVVADALANVTVTAFCGDNSGSATVDVTPVGEEDTGGVDSSTTTVPAGDKTKEEASL